MKELIAVAATIFGSIAFAVFMITIANEVGQPADFAFYTIALLGTAPFAIGVYIGTLTLVGGKP